MKKALPFFFATFLLLFSISLHLPVISYAVGPMESCRANPDNCDTPVNGKEYKCTPFDNGAGFTDMRCQPIQDASRGECRAVNQTCETGALVPQNQKCCAYDTDRQTALLCKPAGGPNTPSTCQRAQTPPTCALEGKPCGKGAPTGQHVCCEKTNDKNETLTCVGKNGEEVGMDQEGTCGFLNKTAPKKSPMPTLPNPPAPPCDSPADQNGCKAVTTGFGALSTEPGKFITTLFGLLLSVSGGIALLLIMKAGYLMMTAAGKPEQIQAGREQLVAAIVGLLFLIFSFVILQVIGVDILRIPGWGGGAGGGNTAPVVNTPNITTCNYSCDTSQNCFNQGGQNAGQASCPNGQICCRPK